MTEGTMVKPFPAATAAGYSPRLRALSALKASGVYIITARRGGQVLYVGESHTGRLYDTITRHFRAWKIDPRNDATGRRRGGTTYGRHEVDICYMLTPAGEAIEAQYAIIRQLKPRDNGTDCHTCAPF